MTITIKTSNEDSIAIPPELMAELNLHEGDQVKVIVEGETMRLARLDKFLSLRGVLTDDPDFDRAVETIEREWEACDYPIWSPFDAFEAADILSDVLAKIKVDGE